MTTKKSIPFMSLYAAFFSSGVVGLLVAFWIHAVIPDIAVGLAGIMVVAGVLISLLVFRHLVSWHLYKILMVFSGGIFCLSLASGLIRFHYWPLLNGFFDLVWIAIGGIIVYATKARRISKH